MLGTPIRDLKVDVCYLRERRVGARDVVTTLVSNRGTQALFLYRIAHELHVRRVPAVPAVLSRICQMLYAIDIDPAAIIGPGAVIFHGFGIVVGRDVHIGRGVVLYHGVTLGNRASGRVQSSVIDGMPTVGQNVVIGAGAKVLGPVVVGEGVVIGANAVVISDVPPHHLAVGVPAHTIANAHRSAVGPVSDLHDLA